MPTRFLVRVLQAGALGIGIAGLVFLATYPRATGPAFGTGLLPPPTNAAASQPSPQLALVHKGLRVGTFNIDGGEGLDGQLDLARTASCLQQLDVVVCEKYTASAAPRRRTRPKRWPACSACRSYTPPASGGTAMTVSATPSSATCPCCGGAGCRCPTSRCTRGGTSCSSTSSTTASRCISSARTSIGRSAATSSSALSPTCSCTCPRRRC